MSTPPRTYSAFWPLLIFFIGAAAWLVYQISETDNLRRLNNRAVAEILPEGEQALTAKKKLFALVQDLNQLSTKDPAAAQILREYQVEVKNPAGTASNPAPAQ